MQKADCMHYSIPFYIRDLIIHKFWYMRGSWNQSTIDTKGPLSSQGVRSYMQIFDCVKGLALQPPHSSMVNCTEYFSFRIIIFS